MEDAKRGKYDKCVKQKLWEGYSRHEAESACSKLLGDATGNSNDINVDFVDSKDGQTCVKKKVNIFANEHPDWSHSKCVAAAHGHCGLSDANITSSSAISMGSIIERARSLSLSKFSTLIKAIKTRAGLKVGGMGILPQEISLPMKNLNRLQTKMEKQVTEESKNLTMEQYEQRKQYAKYMRKDSADLPDLTDEEFVYELENLYDGIVDYYPNLPFEEAIDRAFEPPQGDNAWIMSNESEIVSMNDGLNNIIKAPIILAKEMVQRYTLDGGIDEFHFKPYSELRLAAERAKENGPLDIIIEHQDWYDTENIIGVVKNIRADDRTRTIRGMGYFYEGKLPDGLKQMITDGEIISVSIGFLAKLGDAGNWNGLDYKHRQTDIILRHLAVCLESVARCPPGMCGVNLKDSETANNKIFTIIKDENYYYNICKIFTDSKKETNNKINIEKNLSKIETMQTDSTQGGTAPSPENVKGKIAADEPDDLEAILTRLRILMHGTMEQENATARILAALGIKNKSDSEMEDKELQDAIKLKESELEELKVKLNDANVLIGQFEEKEKLNHIKTIKKFGDKYSEEELLKEDLKSLEKIADAVSRFAPSDAKPDVVPVANKDDKTKLEDDVKKGGKRIDFSKVFDDVKENFDMSGI